MMRPDGHRHLSFGDATLCRRCQPKVLGAKQLYDKVVRSNPEVLVRAQPKFKPSDELKEMWSGLQERVKYDKLYKKHLDLSFHGTLDEQNKETDRVNAGFYEKNSEWRKEQL